MKRLSLLALISAAAWAQTSGVRPRPDADSYPAKDRVPDATIAAAALSSAQVKSVFGTDAYKGYIVMEVAAFPDPNGVLRLSPQDFMLRIGATGEFLRPSAPATIALSINEKNNPPHPPQIRSPVDITTTSTIGYDSAGAYNPNTGKRQGAVYTGTEVAVAPAGTMGRNPTPPSSNRGRSFDDMEAELSAKALAETTVSRPLAGYLYFIPPKKKVKNASSTYDLEYSGDSGRVKLSVPPPSR
jgi:hypothetical protein